MKDGAQAAIAALLSECCHAPGGLYATIPMPSPLQVGITSACADRHSIVNRFQHMYMRWHTTDSSQYLMTSLSETISFANGSEYQQNVFARSSSIMQGKPRLAWHGHTTDHQPIFPLTPVHLPSILPALNDCTTLLASTTLNAACCPGQIYWQHLILLRSRFGEHTSASRVPRDHSSWRALMGVMACAFRISSADASEMPRYLTLPPAAAPSSAKRESQPFIRAEMSQFQQDHLQNAPELPVLTKGSQNRMRQKEGIAVAFCPRMRISHCSCCPSKRESDAPCPMERCFSASAS